MSAGTGTSIRRATRNDVRHIAQLFASVFVSDPVFDWLTRADDSRELALTRFFA